MAKTENLEYQDGFDSAKRTFYIAYCNKGEGQYLCSVIEFEKFTLPNGLRVIHHYDPDSTIVILNILYNCGARDEEINKTGFAHLFEHLMFGGSLNIPEYDVQVENAGGSNNAFTCNDYTNYYITVPAENAETAFWLESDRMLQLDFSQKSLDVQRGVVIEEFKQRCFNAPFGMLWHHLRSLLYKSHPYQWPTIGLKLEHVEHATLEDVKKFYFEHYLPENAIMCVGGKIDLKETIRLTEKWFGSINRTGAANKNQYAAEQPQLEKRFLEETDLSPDPAVFIAWRGPKFADPESISLELFADMLGGSESSPLYLELVKKTAAFSSAECFYMRNLDDGVFIIYGILNAGTTHAEGEKQLMDILKRTAAGQFITERNLEMVKNKTSTHLLFEHTNLLNKAQKLCFFENIGSASLINREAEDYLRPGFENILELAATTFNQDHASIVYYSPKK